MSLTGRHITAGDLTPVTIQTESTYGTPSGDPVLYGDVAEGGNFTFKDTPNPYLTWRYGSRGFSADTYVTQQKDAGFSASLEVRDVAGWKQIIEYAMRPLGGGSELEPMLNSRTEAIYVRTGSSTWEGRKYNGCKTDKLTIRADAPGGIVTFEEEVMASKSSADDLTGALTAWTASTASAVQWMGGMTFDGSDIYPQSFSLTITNNLERIRTPDASGNAITGALIEGRREIEFEADIWMEDLALVDDSIANGSIAGSCYVTLGIANKVRLTLVNPKWVADGSNPALIQDKQRQTIKLRATSVSITTVS